MIDEERQDERQHPDETPAEETSAEEIPPEDAPPAEEALAEDAATESDEPEAPEAEGGSSEERGGASASPGDALQPGTPGGEAEDVPADGEAEAEEPTADHEPGKPPAKAEKKEEVPGAELDPIAIEPERELSAEERARREAEEEERARREAELTSDAVEEQPLAAKPAKLSGDARYLATGKRKSSVARVILTPGNGAIEVNQRRLEEYFPRSYLQSVAKQALVQSGYEGNVDVRVRVHGGGVSGQAAAVRHGIARALCVVDPELRPELKRRGMLTRDARVKERRKAGLKKARKRPQFSKR
jgi:small subunit ribosomal protein S9